MCASSAGAGLITRGWSIRRVVTPHIHVIAPRLELPLVRTDGRPVLPWIQQLARQLGLGHKTHQRLLQERALRFWGRKRCAGPSPSQSRRARHHTFAAARRHARRGARQRAARRALRCGSNSNGQLGLGHLESQTELQAVRAVRGGAREVACGGHHTLILSHAGELFSCGYSAHGRLGLGRDVRGHQTAPRRRRAAARRGAAGAGRVRLGALGRARERRARARERGRNGTARSRLGDAKNSARPRARPEAIGAALPPARELSCGWGHTRMRRATARCTRGATAPTASSGSATRTT